MTELFLDVVNMSVSVGWLVLAVLALRVILKKAPRWIHVLLWGIVAVRLISPFSIESNLSLIPDWKVETQDIISITAGESKGQILDSEKNILVEKDLFGASEGYGQIIGSNGSIILEKPLKPISDSADSTMPGAIRIMPILWLLVMTLMLGYAFFSYLHLKQKVATSVVMQKGIRQSEYIASPFVLGFFRPVVYLPYGMDENDIVHVVAHEMAHIRRKDHWWKPLGFLLLTIHWFNPLMWLAYILLCRDIELACDEKVIKELGDDQRADYTQALVACSVNRRMIAACPLAFGEVGVKERVRTIMNYRKPTFWIIVTALVICCVVAVCFLTDPKPTPEFAMKGSNVSDLDPEGIVERIMEYQDIENSNVYMNANNFSLTVDANFDWVDSQAIRYFYYKNHKVRCAQLRIFPDENKYFLTESDEWPDQNRIFLLRHYLDALKYLPQEAIRQMAPADRYQIEHIDGGSPTGYERVITYSSNGVGETDGWYIHLRILPHHEVGEGYHGTGEEVIHLFYGDSAVDGAEMWFEQVDWDTEREYTIEEFPGVTFLCSAGSISVGEKKLIQGMPIWNAYLCDLNGDGYPEICTEISLGSGIIDNRIIVYDYANGVDYTLERRMAFDYHLWRGSDGQLYADKCSYFSGALIHTGRLVLQEGKLQILGEPSANPAITAIDDPTKDPDFACDTAMEKFFEDDANEYFFSGIYSQYVIVRYEDGTSENIVSAMVSNRATLADLERFDIRYWAEPKARPFQMQPMDTNLKGLCAGALLLPMDGQTYRYLLKDSTPKGVTADELLFSFQEIDMGEHIQNEVYSLKEYPDRSKVLLISGKNGPWVCEYSPPQRCSDTALTDAIEAGYVVMEDGIATHGQDIWQEFYEQTQKGKKASVAIAQYHTLNPEQCDSVYYEIFNQDYPCLYVHQLNYDGKQFALTVDDGNDADTRTYEYLMKFKVGPNDAFSSVVSQYEYKYVLTHDNHFTYDQLWMSVTSSQFGAYIDHYTIYSEPKQ